MTRAELRALFRLTAGPEFDEVPDDSVNDWINEGHRYICSAFQVFEYADSLTFPADVSKIVLPTNFVGLRDQYGNAGTLINRTTNQGLIEIKPAEARLKTITGHTTRIWFWPWDRHIYTLPVVSTGETFELQYFATDKNLTEDDSVVHYAVAYHELLVIYALYKAYMSKVQEGTRDKRALTHWNLFKEQVSIVKAQQQGQAL